MDSLYAIGTLVRVLEKSLCDGWENVAVNRELVLAHGYIYWVEGYDEGNDEFYASYRCKSVASGASDILWLPDEITEDMENA